MACKRARQLAKRVSSWTGMLCFLGVLGFCRPAQAQTITTVAGGGVGDGVLATQAALHTPWVVVADGLGGFYIADRGHHRVRRVDLSGR